MCGLLNLTNVEDSGCTSLRVHLGSLVASGPALALVLYLPVKCGSRTPGLEFCCRIVSCSYDRHVLENTSLNLSNEVVLVIALTLCQFGMYDGIPLLSPRL